MSDSKPLSGITICIDPGHYGKYNKCPSNSKYYESEVMWKLHLLQKKYLEELGAKVITTRSNSAKDLALVTRGKKSKGCDLFISDHSNAIGSKMNENVDYVAVYCLTNDTTTKCDDISKDIATKLAPVIASIMGTKQGYKVLSRKSSTDRNRDGIMNDNYYAVLHGARLVGTPGLILEHSFHTNSRSVSWLLNDSNLDALAKAESIAIAEYFSKKDVELPAEPASNKPSSSVSFGVPYSVKVANVDSGDVLYIREKPDYKSRQTGSLAYNDPNKYTIVEEQNGWGKLKSGIGWINLRYTKKV